MLHMTFRSVRKKLIHLKNTPICCPKAWRNSTEFFQFIYTKITCFSKMRKRSFDKTIRNIFPLKYFRFFVFVYNKICHDVHRMVMSSLLWSTTAPDRSKKKTQISKNFDKEKNTLLFRHVRFLILSVYLASSHFHIAILGRERLKRYEFCTNLIRCN